MIDLGFKGGDTDIHFSPRQNSETVLSLPSRQFKMSLGVVRPLAILAIMAPAIFLSVSADDYNGKWGNSAGAGAGKGLGNRFIVGNWKQRNGGKHLNDAPPNIEDPLSMFRRLTNLPNVSMTTNSTETGHGGGGGGGGGRGGGKRAGERYPQQKWGNSAGEGLDNRFSIANWRQKNADDEPQNANVPWGGEERLLMLPFRRLRSSKYSNATASSDFPISMQCGNSSDSSQVQGCTVTSTRVMNGTNGNHSCYCNVMTSPTAVTTMQCCHRACCDEIVAMLHCGNFSNPLDCNATGVIVQEPGSSSVSIIVQTESANQTESTTEVESSDDIAHSTTAAHGGSAPARGQDLAAVAAALLIFIHGRGRVHFL